MSDNDTYDELLSACRLIADELSGKNRDWWVEYCEEFGEDAEDSPYAGAYLNDALDCEYTCRLSDGEFLGAMICVSYGGPNIYINTRNDTVEGYWGSKEVSVAFFDSMDIHGYIAESR